MIVPWEETTPPAKYGGIELVANNLAGCLRESGHNVVILGTEDSSPDSDLIPVFKKATRSLPHSADALAREAHTFLGISRAIEALENIDADIVHNHLGWRLLMFRSLIKQRMLSTLHLNLDNTYEQDIYKLVSNHPFVSISMAQRKPLPNLNYVSNIYNGIRVHSFDFRSTSEDYLVFLGSFTPHKGPDKAIEIAKRSGRRLIMAGKIDPLKTEYFDTVIRPQIDDRQILFIGEVDHDEKNRLLGNSAALLMPISWSEPFGLVMTEAFACGTPVIAMKRGSTPEIIKHGRNGFLCDDIDCMVSCIKKIPKIKRRHCRETAESRFSVETMTEKYVEAYSQVISENK